MFTKKLLSQVTLLLELLKKQKIKIVTAESCTGGLLAALFTEIPGSSEIFERGYVTYSNESKADSLKIPLDLINNFGAVSSEIARLMAEGAIHNSKANLALAITGIAGPGGGTKQVPVGLVYIAIRYNNVTNITKNLFSGTRSEIRMQTVKQSLELLTQTITE